MNDFNAGSVSTLSKLGPLRSASVPHSLDCCGCSGFSSRWRSAMDDCVVKMLLKLGSPLTQQNYLQLAYWDDRTIDDLGPEELAELPEGFEEWPKTEKEIH